jgi:hypothetical protein
MRGKSYPSGMGDTMSVKYGKIRCLLHFFESLQQDRSFPEAQQSGKIRKRDPFNGMDLFDRLHVRIGEKHDGGKKQIAPAAIGNVRAGDDIHRSYLGSVMENQFFFQGVLDRYGFLIWYIPGMKKAQILGFLSRAWHLHF